MQYITTTLLYGTVEEKALENGCFVTYLKDKLLIDHFLADAGLEIGRLEETQEELVDQLYEEKDRERKEGRHQKKDQNTKEKKKMAAR